MVKTKTKRPEGIKSILDKVIVKIESNSPRNKEFILKTWQRTAGKKASSHSRPVSVRKSVLTVEVDSSTWLYELNLLKRSLLRDIKKELGQDKVKNIRFRMGDIT